MSEVLGLIDFRTPGEGRGVGTSVPKDREGQEYPDSPTRWDPCLLSGNQEGRGPSGF